jgi:hypothetical protein
VLKVALFRGAGLMMATDMIMQRHVAEVSCARSCKAGLATLLNSTPSFRAAMPELRAFIDFLVSKLTF